MNQKILIFGKYHNIDLKAIILKCTEFQANIFKNKKNLNFLWTTTEFPHL